MMDAIERVAEHLKRTYAASTFMPIPDAETGLWQDMARAAIEAMREPTKEMLIEGNSAIDQHIDFYNYDSGAGYSVEPQAAYACLNAMIDRALNPQT